MFDAYIKSSDLAPYTAAGGYWRYLGVRLGSNGEVLVMVVIHPQDLSEERLDTLRKDIVDFFVNREGSDCNIVSIYFKLYALFPDK